MTIASEITKLNTNLTNSYAAVSNKGGTIPSSQNFDNLATSIATIPTGITPTGTISITQNGTYNVTNYANADVNVSGGGGISNVNDNYLIRINGDIKLLTKGTFTLGAKDTDIPNDALNSAYEYDRRIERVNLKRLTTISGDGAIEAAFAGSGLISVDLSSLTTISGDNAMGYAFGNCPNLISVDLSSLTTISGDNAMDSAFAGSNLISVDLSSLTTISGDGAMSYAFADCASFMSISFPALTSISFGSHTNQFELMLEEVRKCTVHFPSNLQSVIGSWSDVTSGFGGKETTVLFDLPATT